MPTDLERDLGLYTVITISIGAMIGSGIFVLPGIAATMAGPAVILAYLLAGLVVLPAALSKAEMATAMPESGGTYLYIDRAMGPLLGTIAGIGVWFSLTFKSAFALVGLGAYLLLFTAIPTKPVALALGVFLIGVNIVGVKQSGRLQAITVTGVLAVLVLFIANGLTFVQAPHYHPFFSEGPGGLLEAAGFVFVSYAGVTKIASVAEEIEDPGRNIPLGILVSVVTMMIVYTFIVFVIIGVIDPTDLGKTLTPMADAAGRFLGPSGVIGVAVTAVVALASMANAGILSSSRYPLAMARDRLAPARLAAISDRFSTPVHSIGITGGILLVLIAFVPVVELAKLASAFKILVFTLINLAFIAFRESDLAGYDPEFVAPGYPWVQLFGIGGSLVLLTQLGAIPFLGAIGIIVAGAIWYRVYGREKTEREGAALDAVRRRTDRQILERYRDVLGEGGEYRVLLPVQAGVDEEREAALLRVAANLVHGRDGRVEVIRFTDVPEQTPLQALVADQGPEDESFERYTHELADEFGVHVEVGEIAAHDVYRAIVNHAEDHDVDVILASWAATEQHEGFTLGGSVDFLLEHADCDVIFVEDHGVTAIDEVLIVDDVGPYDPLKVAVAHAIAVQTGASMRLFHLLPTRASDAQLDSVREYHDEIAGLCSVPVEGEVVRTDDEADAIAAAVDPADVVVMGVSSHRHLSDVLFGTLQDAVIRTVDGTVILVHPAEPRSHTFLRSVLQRVVY